MGAPTVTGTGVLLRLLLRRDRVVLTCWVVGIVGIGLGTVAYYLGLFADPSARLAFVRDAAAAPALLAFNGPIFDSGLDVLATWRMRDLSHVLIALMALLTAVRHTRGEEEAGRLEVLGSTAVGRHAGPAAAMTVALGASVLAAALNGLGMAALGLSPAGCAVYALTASATGAVFGAVGVLAAQVAGSARGALGLAPLALGGSYVLRFVADGSGSAALAWFTPLGWAHLSRPFAGERPWVLALPVALTAVLVVAAHLVVARRDLGAGLLAARPGPATGELAGPLALAWRLQRGLLAGWVAGFAVAGVFFGALVASVGSASAVLAGSAPLRIFVERYAGASTAPAGDVFLWVIALSLGYTAALYPALVVARLRTEEAAGRAEPLLTAAVDRRRWAAGPVLIAAAGTVAVLAAGGVTAGTVLAAATGDPAQLGRALAGTLIQVPAAWLLGALTVLTFGLLPRLTAAVAWAGFLVVQLFELVAPLAGVDFTVVEVVIPFWHLPRILTGDAFTPVPLIVLTAVAATAVAAGLAALRRRDLVPTS